MFASLPESEYEYARNLPSADAARKENSAEGGTLIFHSRVAGAELAVGAGSAEKTLAAIASAVANAIIRDNPMPQFLLVSI